MKVVVAVDSFKGSMTSMEAGMAVKAGVLAAHKDAEVIVKPLADGGEGTTDALIEGMGGEKVVLQVTGPVGEPVEAYYGWIAGQQMAVMEMTVPMVRMAKMESRLNSKLTEDIGISPMIMNRVGIDSVKLPEIVV